jgi:ubiquinone/menaquinone biosynthesis C-methylase UbiE/DNA-binding transcriptional ArsR family regulator
VQQIPGPLRARAPGSILISGYMNATILPQLAALADVTRARLLLVLERHELAVSELCAVVQLPQSTVSRHLGVLSGEGWLTSRPEGTSHFYRLATGLSGDARRVWEVVREPLSSGAEAQQDVERAREVLARRRTRSQEFFSSTAGQWDSVRTELFGSNPELPALLALLDPGWVVGDLGCGTGGVAETVAPFVRRVVGVDESADMLAAAASRLEASPVSRGRVELRAGRLEALPLEDASLDVALLVLVLHYVVHPERALVEAWRVLRPGGRILIVDMARHGRSEYRERMGHVWEGFDRDQLEGWLSGSGFDGAGYHPLPAAPGARGPLLFAAAATKRQ